MVWPTATTTRDNALERVDQTAARLKANCVRWRAILGNGDVAADFVTEEVLRGLVVSRAVFADAAAVPGIAAYVASQRSVTEQQVIDAFTDMDGAVEDAIGWIVNALPKNAGGFLLLRTIAADGAMAYRSFTPAETAGLRTILQAVEATIG